MDLYQLGWENEWKNFFHLQAVSDESKDVEDEVADRGKFINSMKTTMYSHPILERAKQKLLGISSIEQFVMIWSGKF